LWIAAFGLFLLFYGPMLFLPHDGSGDISPEGKERFTAPFP
jgi:hypothetical protein